MKIEYLNKLKDNFIKRVLGVNLNNRPIPFSEIVQLEQLYNNGNPFPKALRELLYLAGDYCCVLDYGRPDSQQELQEFVREQMAENGRIIIRPFYAIEVYNNDLFLFVYLDEGDNPPVYQGNYFDDLPRPHWIEKLEPESLSDFINRDVKREREWYNPF